MEEELKKYLELTNKSIETHKDLAIAEIQREEMIPATNDLLTMRDLKAQKLLIEKILKGAEDK